ncbi:CPBP family intramembrane glutamic endopeptidase [Paenibacillus whitsoniae]|nr:CPBP family intramembrane glutamic endopeptidase [Paenibacillus whitsoniae]
MSENINKRLGGRPVLFSIGLGLALTLLVSIAAAAATIADLGDSGIMAAQGAAFLVMAIIITGLMRKNDRTMAAYGFKPFAISDHRSALYYIPLLVIALVQPMMGGVDTGLTIGKVMLIFAFSLVVGYTEESIFRGVIRERLKARGAVFYICFSSLLFGILHIANALAGKDWLAVTLQVVNAFLIGLILALLIELTGHIVPLILFHFVYDALAQVTNPALQDHEVLVVSILNVFYLLYGLYLVVILTRRKKASFPVTV